MEMRESTKQVYIKFLESLNTLGLLGVFKPYELVAANKLDAKLTTFLVKAGYINKFGISKSDYQIIAEKFPLIPEEVVLQFNIYRGELDDKSKRDKAILKAYNNPTSAVTAQGFTSNIEVQRLMEEVRKEVRQKISAEAAEAAEWAIKHNKPNIAQVVLTMLTL